MAKKKPKELPYHVILHTGSEELSAKGATMFDALSNLKPKKEPKLVGRIRVIVDGKETPIKIPLKHLKMKRLFANRWEMEIFAKRLDALR